MSLDTTKMELAFVGDLVFPNLTPHEMMACVEAEGVRSEYFKDPGCRAVFDALMASQNDDDTGILVRLSGVAEQEWLGRCRDGASISVELARANVRGLAETARRRIAQEGVERLMAEFRGGALDLDGLSRKLAELNETTRLSRDDGDSGRTLDELGPQVPEEENPDALFRNGWIRKGNAAFLVAETGKGKSVLSLQMAYCWARGVPAFGIAPMRPLKIAVFQTEDDDDEMRAFRDNLKRGFGKFHGWTDGDLKRANDNLRLFSTEGLVGEKFTDLMRRKLAGRNFDLVILNPLQGVFGGDLNQNSELSGFLRTGLDGVIKSNSTKCGVLIVHHTNKPNPDPRYRRLDAYVGAGGAELANWIRAMLILDEQKGKEGTFRLVAPKRGKRLAWTKRTEQGEHPYVSIRHAPKEANLIFWLEDDSSAAGTGETKMPEETFEDKAKRFAEALRGKAESGDPCTKTEARALARNLMKNKREGYNVYDFVIKDLDKYGLCTKKTGNSTGQVIVLKDG